MDLQSEPVATRPSEERLLAEQLRLIDGNVRGTLLPTYLLGGVLFAFAPVDRLAIGVWWAAVAISKTAATLDAQRRLKSPIDPANARALVRRLVIANIIDGICWGSITVAAFERGSPPSNAIVIAVITGCVGSSVSLLSPVLPVFWAFTCSALLVSCARVSLLHDPTAYLLIAAAAVYMMNMGSQARGSAAAARAAIELRFANIELVEQLRDRSAVADAARHDAEQANLAKSKFLAAASHDLRQPVHAQGMLLETLSKSHLSPEQRTLLESVHAASGAVGDMLDTLLDFSRIEAGVISVRERPFRLQTLLKRIENELSHEAEKKGIVFRARDTSIVVHSDPALAERIVRNLAVNAIRYTQAGGVLIGCRKRGPNVVVEVWDTGIGIAPADQQAIFREFHQLGTPHGDHRGGLGLGLAIAESLAQKLGQHITLASRVGRGSVFRLRLPLSHEVIVPDEQAVPLAGALGEIHVLLIDDDELVRVAMTRLLGDWGCRCTAVESLDAAMAAVRAERPDVVVSDYRLREENTGAQVVLALREAFGSDLPAFLLTGDTAPERINEAHRSGLPLLHKPLTPNQLQRAIREVIQRGAT